ncbi:MAG: hypothetical protein PHY23_04675 [Oscillospiraceae bacterium]|jgi:hypothetical protein|nr:hypothetical protein [Oscillospiraceae bacterium]
MDEKYFAELSRILRKHGIESGPVENGRLVIQMDGQPVGRIEPGGMRCVAPGDLLTEDASKAFYRAAPFAEMVAEYMESLKRAPTLIAEGLDADYLLLAEFNGTVLAGKEMEGGYGMQFVTWDWNYDHTAVEQGHYYHDNYEGAKADFAVRSGLIQKGCYFSEEQLTEMYRCMHDMLDGEYELTDNQETLISDTCEQIEKIVPDLRQRIAQTEEVTHNFEQTM